MERDSLPPCKKWHNPTGSLWLQGLNTHTLPFYFSAERLEVLKSPDQDHVGWKHWFEMIYTPGLKVRMTVWEIPMPILDDISQLQLRRQNHEIMTQMECRCTCKIHKKEQKKPPLPQSKQIECLFMISYMCWYEFIACPQKEQKRTTLATDQTDRMPVMISYMCWYEFIATVSNP